MQVALKERAAVSEALAEGRQNILLRKSGIAEGKRSLELEHDLCDVSSAVDALSDNRFERKSGACRTLSRDLTNIALPVGGAVSILFSVG